MQNKQNQMLQSLHHQTQMIMSLLAECLLQTKHQTKYSVSCTAQIVISLKMFDMQNYIYYRHSNANEMKNSWIGRKYSTSKLQTQSNCNCQSQPQDKAHLQSHDVSSKHWAFNNLQEIKFRSHTCNTLVAAAVAFMQLFSANELANMA